MSLDGVIHFRNEGLDTIQASTKGQQERYIEIWDTVRNQLLALVNNGQVDAQIGTVLTERDQRFRREAAGFDQSVSSQNTAMRQVQGIGNEGGAAMVRAAAGGR
ncbi:hypothetical protein [Streptomyces triticirhizae]|uniref:Uncharacterized protein n=1 Tax=Streptomyces triticirhizae TaxID=2483353 RepID=A0A3M2KU78_9ACTN|nr:hypothetical protein [Streptomyces triticirhizae]RMI27793.1 hypothetical protein EBN88_28860 [Streptomyces triticirhizae]